MLGNIQGNFSELNLRIREDERKPNGMGTWAKAILKALANEEKHCCGHIVADTNVCPRAQHLLRTQKMFLILFRNILCPQQMFPSLRSPRNIKSNNVSSFSSTLRGVGVKASPQYLHGCSWRSPRISSSQMPKLN